jgi:FtsP/CotA-like multicopper oxidase with cupredoxin domain
MDIREKQRMKRQAKIITAFLVPVVLTLSSVATAEIAGINGPTFDLTARAGHIVLGDANNLLAWGYGETTATEMQYPGPTLIVNEGASVTVTLRNSLSEPVSIVFPGQSNVTATGGTPGLLTNEIAAGEVVTYSFTASEPGTYLYQSGSNQELQIEMGMVGALIVCPGSNNATPTGCSGGNAYGTDATAYDQEYLFFQTEMDPAIHDAVELGQPVDFSNYLATLWFINGRNGPDTLHADNVGWMPLQPYGALAQTKPSDRVLMRVIGAGRDLHPFHHHGNNAWIVAQDGRVLESAPGADAPYPDFQGRPSFVGPGGNTIPALAPIPSWPANATLPDQAVSNYTILTTPGSTYDAIWTWTGLGMNWDIYGDRPGHMADDCGAALPEEDPASHCLDLEGANGKVILPEQQALTFGGLWSGSPYMGSEAALPPDQGGLNPNFGFSFMWHSHTERELTNDDIFPGGMMTMMIVEAPDVTL